MAGGDVRRRLGWAGLACLSLAIACAKGSSAVAGEAGPQVRIAQGELAGVVTDNGVVAYKGIPYAKPPTGALRWKAPVPAAGWRGLRDAKAFGPACMQPPQSPASLYYPGVVLPVSEDCLTLNVWAPPGARKLPVMVWIHGGALAAGSSSEPLVDGAKLARKGIVVVSINYRLGVFGYLAHPALSAEAKGLSGNYGLLDQVAALRWVQDNVAAFGGDPKQVTIAGESAGGLSVIALVASPLARGLYGRAIAQSGYMPSYSALHEEALGLSSAEEAGAALAKAAGLTDASALRAADAAALFKAELATGWQPEPVIDGVALKRQLAETFARGEQAHVPILAGFNEGEIRSLSFLAPKAPDSPAAYVADVRRRFGAQADAYLAIYPGADPQGDVMASIRDGLYGWAAQYVVQQQAAAGQPAYLYYFRHGTPAERERDLVAFHASELPYVFGQIGADAPFGANWPQPPRTEAESQLSDAMMSYWASFVRTGVPQAPGEAAWPRFRATQRGYLEIEDRPVAREALHSAAFGWASDLVASRLRQGRRWQLDIGFAAYPQR